MKPTINHKVNKTLLQPKCKTPDSSEKIENPSTPLLQETHSKGVYFNFNRKPKLPDEIEEELEKERLMEG